jgi:hypothetical protein
MVKITKLIHLLMVFMHFSIQFWTLTRIRNLEIRIRQKVPDPCGSGSTTLFCSSYDISVQVCLLPHPDLLCSSGRRPGPPPSQRPDSEEGRQQGHDPGVLRHQDHVLRLRRDFWRQDVSCLKKTGPMNVVTFEKLRNFFLFTITPSSVPLILLALCRHRLV